jgi:hypothetical protein
MSDLWYGRDSHGRASPASPVPHFDEVTSKRRVNRSGAVSGANLLAKELPFARAPARDRAPPGPLGRATQRQIEPEQAGVLEGGPAGGQARRCWLGGFSAGGDSALCPLTVTSENIKKHRPHRKWPSSPGT